MSGKVMALNIVNQINNKLKFVYFKNSLLTPALRRLLCNALIQSHFDYVCSAWYSNLTKKLIHRIVTTQNKCMPFCLHLDNLKHISHEEFDLLNWLPVTYRFKQCVNTMKKNEVFDVVRKNNFQLKSDFQNLKCQFCQTNIGQLALSYIGPTF